MARLQQLQADPELEKNGIWVHYALDVELLIGRSGTVEFDRVVRELTQPFLKIYRTQQLPPDITNKIMLQATAKCLLLGWKNMDADTSPVETQEDSKEYRPIITASGVVYQEVIPYSYEKALEIISDPRNHDLYRFVLVTSNEQALFRNQLQTEALGNSLTSSIGN